MARLVFMLLIVAISIWAYQLITVRLENFNPKTTRRSVQYKEEGFCGVDGRNYQNVDDNLSLLINTNNTNDNHDRNDQTTEDQTTEQNKKKIMMHKGPCGICSNPHDYKVYKETRMTLTRTATWCAVGYLLMGESVSRWCLTARTGMSEPCVECWVQNIQCTTAMCSPTCVKHFVSTIWERAMMLLGLDGMGEYSSQFGKDNLSPCFKCDEIECGPSFKKCSGLNRRNAGFETDIPRPESEMWRG